MKVILQIIGKTEEDVELLLVEEVIEHGLDCTPTIRGHLEQKCGSLSSS
jgi:hypothetical protein